MAEVRVNWVEGFQFIGTGSNGHTIVLDAPAKGGGKGEGIKPSELLLLGLAGCTGYDVVQILTKQRQEIRNLEVSVEGLQAADPPWPFEKIIVTYKLKGNMINETFVQRAIELSETKYCSVGATISGKATIETRYEIEQSPS